MTVERATEGGISGRISRRAGLAMVVFALPRLNAEATRFGPMPVEGD